MSLAKQASELTTQGRNQIPAKNFAFEKGRRYPIEDLCLAGSTCVALLDGREVPIRDLVGQEAWVYGYDLQTRAVVPALATDIRKTLDSTDTLRVWLDNGDSVECTTNHPFLLRGGTYKIAGELAPGDSLMPLYRKKGQKERVEGSERQAHYEMIWQPWYSTWEFTHRLVLRETQKHPLLEGEVAHHRDFNQLNNLPDNLERMSRAEHAKIHGAIHPDSMRAHYGDEEARARVSAASKARWAIPGAREKHSEYMKKENVRRQVSGEGPDIAEKIRLKKLEYWNGNASVGRKQRAADAIRIAAEVRNQKLLDAAGTTVEALYGRYLDGIPVAHLAAELKISSSSVRQWFTRHELPLKYEMAKAANDNHKVVRVETAGVQPVYDLTVEGVHNFALTAGIFVHNSHARNALARVSAHGTPGEKAEVRREVKQKYPALAARSKVAAMPKSEANGSAKGASALEFMHKKAEGEDQEMRDVRYKLQDMTRAIVRKPEKDTSGPGLRATPVKPEDTVTNVNVKQWREGKGDELHQWQGKADGKHKFVFRYRGALRPQGAPKS